VRKGLADLGLIYTVGHGGGACPKAPEDDQGVRFTVVDVNGVHSTRLRFCHCFHSGTRARQLTRSRLFPATIEQPETAISFNVIRQFHIQSFESKKSVFDFVGALRRMTNNVRTELVPVSVRRESSTTTNPHVQDPYFQFLRVVRVWRVLTMEKRSGQAHGIDKVLDLQQPGSLLVRCPACPRPFFNMDPAWAEIKEPYR
jgi:CxC2 like cysteine cluster associated with KDZ transposases